MKVWEKTYMFTQLRTVWDYGTLITENTTLVLLTAEKTTAEDHINFKTTKKL